MLFGVLECVFLVLGIYWLIIGIKSYKEDEKLKKHYICKFEEMFDRDRYLCYELEDAIEDIKYKIHEILEDK